MKYALRGVALVGGFLTALLFSHHDSFSWYGASHGSDPLACCVWILATFILVKGADYITK
jgi:D-alanyl-lipoteichoic acid acyltransferase DltB (MBOAT superfamily)